MVIAGIDYSINCPSICIYDDTLGKLSHDTSLYFFNQGTVSKKEVNRRNELGLKNIFANKQYKWSNNYARYYALADWAISILMQYGTDIVCIEDYALHAQGLTWNIAEATSILRHLIMMCGLSLYAFSPTLVKKNFFGKGNADKRDMVTAYKMRYNVDVPEIFGTAGKYDSPISDMVDSHAMIHTYLNGSDIEQFRLF